MADFQVLFDNFDLNSISYVEFSRRFPNNEAPRDLLTHDLVRRPGSVLTSIKIGERSIPLEGYINAPSRTAYEQSYDELKFRTSGIEKPLIIIQGGETRKYTATKENLIEEHIEAGKTKLNLSFRCVDPYGKASVLTAATQVVTAAPDSLSHVFLGTAEVMPIVVYTLGTISTGTNKTIGFGNSRTGQQVQVTRNWTAGDVVSFDCDKKRAYVNGAVSDYSGVFPVFYPGNASAYYTDDLTSRSVTTELSYAKQYL